MSSLEIIFLLSRYLNGKGGIKHIIELDCKPHMQD